MISSSFGTISEYFFLTMRLLHVGVLPVFPVLKEITRECQQIEEHSDRIEQQLAGLGNHPQAGQLAATRDAFAGLRPTCASSPTRTARSCASRSSSA